MNIDLGKAIRTCRAQKGMTAAVLACGTGISLSYLSLVEHNQRNPTLSTIENIAETLNIPLAILVFLATDKSKFESISPELAEKLSLLTLKLMEVTNE